MFAKLAHLISLSIGFFVLIILQLPLLSEASVNWLRVCSSIDILCWTDGARIIASRLEMRSKHLKLLTLVEETRSLWRLSIASSKIIAW